MELGTALLWLCLAVTIAALAAYVASAFDSRKLPLARMAYYAMTTGAVGASIYLVQLILTHEFNAQYVFSYTSRDLPLVYLISAFWAGQEGSILLWALFGAVIGVILAGKSKDYEPWVMAFWCCIQAFYFTLLLVKSPFAQTPVEMLARFPDGQGLNPLLQNFWIAIHPPVLFLGYAAMAVPAAFVIAGLIRKDFTSWSNRCLPWAIFGWVTLGAGIILGSYWAYEVLGWGGYWGWDPVENASLVPWISATALLHSMLVERYRGSMRRTNIALALLTFLLVIYAAYLTRSGILGDFSVHSFEASVSSSYLLGFLLFFTLLSIGVYVWRGRKAESRSWYGQLVSKEFAFFVGLISLSMLALLVLFCTSSPLITMTVAKYATFLRTHLGSFGKTNPTLLKLATIAPSAVKQAFYAKVTIPPSLVILIALTLAPLLAWTRRAEDGLVKRNPLTGIMAGGVGLVLMAAAIAWRAKGPDAAVSTSVGMTAVLAVLVNGSMALRYGRGNWKMAGGYIAHCGIALMFLGMVFSPSIQDPEHITVPQGGEVKRLGYTFSFLEATERPGGVTFRLKVTKDGKIFIATPVIRPTNQGAVRVPYIRKSIDKDLYIAPVQISVPRIEPALKMGPKGMEFIKAVTPDGGAVVRLMKMQVETKTVILLIERAGQRAEAIQLAKDESKQVGKYNLTFEGFHVTGDHGGMGGGDTQYGAVLDVDYPGVAASAVLEVSIKRFISLLWLGAILTLSGGIIAIIRRTGENRKLVRDDADSGDAEADESEDTST